MGRVYARPRASCADASSSPRSSVEARLWARRGTCVALGYCEVPMPEQKPLRPGQRNVYHALLGLYSGLESAAVPMYAFAAAGGRVALRAIALRLLSKFRAQKNRPDPKATPNSEAKAVGQPERVPVQSATVQAPPTFSDRNGGPHTAPSAKIPRDAIALRAYDKFLVRGGENGHDREDWSAASRELSLECGAPSRE